MNTAWSRPTKYIAAVALALLGLFLLYLARPVIPLLILAALIAVIVRPLILWLQERLKFPRSLAVGLVYLILAILAPLALLLLIPAIADAIGYVLSLDYQSILQGMLNWLRSTLSGLRDMQLPVPAFDAYVDRTVETVLEQLQQVTPTEAAPPEEVATPSLPALLQSLGSVLTTTFGFAAGLVGAVFSQAALIVFMFLASIYISLGAHTYRSSLLRTVPEAYQPEMAILLARIERLWNAFFRGQLTLMLIIGLVTWLGLTILGVPGALYLGITAGLLEIIPSLGPVIATVPAVIVALLQGSSYLPLSPLLFALVVVLFYILVQQLENNVIVPRVLGGAVELSPLVVMTGVLVGATVGGILGALLAAPVIATGREILRYVYRKLQGLEPFPAAEETAAKGEPSAPGVLERLRLWLQAWANARQPRATPPHLTPPPAPENEPGPEEK